MKATKDEALRMAIKTLSWYDDKEVVLETIGYCEEALAETQEPMTHVIGLDNDGKEVVVKLQTPLYTTPPSRKWQSLSDDEIKEIHNASVGKNIGFATGLTEEKLREKNND